MTMCGKRKMARSTFKAGIGSERSFACLCVCVCVFVCMRERERERERKENDENVRAYEKVSS